MLDQTAWCPLFTIADIIKLMKGKALRQQGLHEKIAASVLLKLKFKPMIVGMKR